MTAEKIHSLPLKPPRFNETELLHQGGRPGHWGNLGLWTDAADYAQACQNLALAVGRAAEVEPGDRVLSVACGAGEELVLWVDALGAGAVVGTELNPSRVAAALPRLAPRLETGQVTIIDASTPPAGPFDVIVCVDAAYHLSPRTAWLQQCYELLRDGGRLAFTDLVLPTSPGARPRGWAWAAAARACGLALDDLVDSPCMRQRLHDTGFVHIHPHRLDDVVLGGFVRHVRGQSRRLGWRALAAAWRRPLLTALMIPPARAAGLGYVLVSAQKPAAEATP